MWALKTCSPVTGIQRRKGELLKDRRGENGSADLEEKSSELPVCPAPDE